MNDPLLLLDLFIKSSIFPRAYLLIFIPLYKISLVYLLLGFQDNIFTIVTARPSRNYLINNILPVNFFLSYSTVSYTFYSLIQILGSSLSLSLLEFMRKTFFNFFNTNANSFINGLFEYLHSLLV